MKIVVVEDGTDHARIIMAVLRKEGHDPIHFESGAPALEYLLANPLPDLLLTDIMMPGMSGFELLERLKEADRMPPCFVLTGKQREEDVLRGLQFGVLDYITKPFSPSVLVAKINNIKIRKSA